MKKIVILTLIVFVSGMIAFLYHAFSTAIKASHESDKIDSITTSQVIPKQIAGLLKKDTKLIFDKSTYSKSRNPISHFTYDNRFNLIVYEISKNNILSLKDDIRETYSNQHITYNKGYNVTADFKKHEIEYVSGYQDSVFNIYINIGGKDTQILQKDYSIAYYSSHFDNFYIKYQFEGNQDFYGRVKEKFEGAHIPLEILFIKSNGKVFQLLMSPNDDVSDIKPGTLLSLIQA